MNRSMTQEETLADAARPRKEKEAEMSADLYRKQRYPFTVSKTHLCYRQTYRQPLFTD